MTYGIIFCHYIKQNEIYLSASHNSSPVLRHISNSNTFQIFLVFTNLPKFSCFQVAVV